MPRPALLDDAAADELGQLGSAELVVGIPSLNTERTIGHVVKAVQYGLAKYYPATDAVVVVSDGGSADATREQAHRAALYSDFDTMLIRQPAKPARVVVAQYRGPGGKGSALRAVLEAARLLDAKCVVTVDADLRSITPEWLEVLAGPVLLKGYDFVVPHYARHKWDGTITNMMVYPLTRALYGVRVRQPIGGDVGMSGALVGSALARDVWGTDVARFGIDIWLTTLAVNEGLRVCQGNLGAKAHDPKDPRQHLGPMVQQVMSTVFRLMAAYAPRWMEVKGSRPVREFGFKAEVGPAPVELDPAPMAEAFREGVARHRERWEPLFSPGVVHGLLAVAGQPPPFRFPPELWARVVYELAAAHAFLEGKEPAAAALLVESLVPLYLGRVAAFVEDTRAMSTLDAERVVEQQAEAFEAAKPHLVERWRGLGLAGP